ncbi:MAG TPA: hypothetical protein VFS04_04715 [Alphaproteobacteria bacterium]|nr:hypothetical protein [Alphaproteobacteria bacterium]
MRGKFAPRAQLPHRAQQSPPPVTGGRFRAPVSKFLKASDVPSPGKKSGLRSSFRRIVGELLKKLVNVFFFYGFSPLFPTAFFRKCSEIAGNFCPRRKPAINDLPPPPARSPARFRA